MTGMTIVELKQRTKFLFFVAVSIWILVVLAIPVYALVPQPNVKYSGEVRIEAPEHGAAVTIPEGWVGVLPEGQNIFIVASTSHPGTVIIGAEEMTLAETQKEMSNPIDLGQGIILNPVGEVSVKGQALTGRFEVKGGQEPLVGYMKTVIGSHGSGVTFLALTNKESLPAYEKVLEQMVASLTLGPKKEPPAPGEGGGPLYERLKNQKAHRFYGSSGYREHEWYVLCADGRFYWRIESGGGDSSFSMIHNSRENGRWKTTGSETQGMLILTWSDGQVSQKTVAISKNSDGSYKLFLNGTRWYHEVVSCQ